MKVCCLKHGLQFVDRGVRFNCCLYSLLRLDVTAYFLWHEVNLFVLVLKKYACYSGFFCGDLRLIPLSPIGDFKNPSGKLAGPRASAPASVRRFAPLSGLRSGPRARSRARGDFQIPSEQRGSGAKSPRQNPNFIFKFHEFSSQSFTHTL